MKNKKINIQLRKILEEVDRTNTSQKNKKEKIEKQKAVVKAQYEEISQYQNVEINDNNKKQLENLILATEILISNSKEDEFYYGNKDENFVGLIYICQRLNLKMETYKIEKNIQEIKIKNNDIEKKQKQLEKNGNDLVYNLLGFLTSFSIISASVEAIGKIEGIINIMLFITFTILILLTTLIALNNFYKKENKCETKLQNNYFLWKVVVVIIIILFIVSSILFIKDEKKNILNFLDEKIEKIIEQRIDININQNNIK